jgi:hypothetical protein
VANEHEVEVEVVGTLPIVLYDGFTIVLNNVIYVPSLQTSHLSINLLENDGYKCNFGNNNCFIKFNDKIFGLAAKQGML